MIPHGDLVKGLWYQDIDNPIFVEGYQVSFMKIYSLGVTQRVMELSTYPRAYKDTDPHVYEEDTPFIVTEDDLIWFYSSAEAEAGEYEVREDIEDGTFVYRHFERGDIRLIGEEATHYAGDPLPGAFPMWIESETLPSPSWVEKKKDIFPFVFAAVKGELCTVNLQEAEYRLDDEVDWSVLPENLFNTYKDIFQISEKEIKVTKLIKNKDRTILRVLYDRIMG